MFSSFSALTLQATTMPKMDGINSPALRKGDPEPPLTPGRGRIYALRFSPFAERVVLYAAAKGIDVEVVNVNLAEKPDWYINKHPQCKVPSFERDGKIVIESAIIAEYLDVLYPSSSILSMDPYLRATQKIIREQAAPLVDSFLGLFGVYGGSAKGDEAQARVKKVEDALDVVEKLLKDDYFGGSSPGYGDWMLFPMVERVALLSDAVALPFPSAARWPALSRWWLCISVHPAAVAVMHPTDVHLGFMKTLTTGKPDPDYGI
ncbi:hypothetical protein PRIPAC_82115 [Pristionchus pacificus]|uniref:Glutathione S-transferase omega n=1 Tax=Pristionchus pacificus TaxID=54126 RepID=A0A2A6CKS3_PRIPA|nr:hypothetical protein PRIPAC_82115 [Pristionchus pacificus]|eukprot:PDM78719.1 Glutathione S-transferase [Pristionchus pacificus]